jgi:hypothetical protein
MMGRIGGVELAPMSTSKDMGVALKYAQTNCISSIIFEYEVLCLFAFRAFCLCISAMIAKSHTDFLTSVSPHAHFLVQTSGLNTGVSIRYLSLYPKEGPSPSQHLSAICNLVCARARRLSTRAYSDPVYPFGLFSSTEEYLYPPLTFLRLVRHSHAHPEFAPLMMIVLQRVPFPSFPPNFHLMMCAICQRSLCRQSLRGCLSTGGNTGNQGRHQTL